jgi:site-specific recombinase XerD
MAVSKRKPEETSPLIEKFLNYKLVIQGRSPKTVDEYHLDLRLFFRYIISRQNGISTSSEEFEKINISIVDERFVRTIQTIDILEFMSYLASERKDAAAARSRKPLRPNNPPRKKRSI